jgi:hypothetical protein
MALKQLGTDVMNVTRLSNGCRVETPSLSEQLTKFVI